MGCWWCWLLVTLLWVSTITNPCLGQSGDSSDWGSGFDVSMTTLSSNKNTSSSQEPGDYPAGSETETRESWVKILPPKPVFHYKPEPDECSVHFSTSQASARRLKAQREELAYLKAIQHGNQAVVENLVQYIGAELGDEQRYEDVIEENIVGIREEQQSCNGVLCHYVVYYVIMLCIMSSGRSSRAVTVYYIIMLCIMSLCCVLCHQGGAAEL
ncbi:uncharacterized protein si:ch211-142k18.1 isoform X2 [Salmo salar]|uniref:Uncharacterized protein si:ch211-142k18.1 isoform X2 n=1 Tax=Salmo salar TaxID=8030 RepID=A0ABM3F1D5_SALSA|nr:uncharacterized protein si:ch211-142k18.1 isoform X2 [Salmo salar]